MGTRELRGSAASEGQTLRLVDAAKVLELNYRHAKRLWQRVRIGRSPRNAAVDPGEVFGNGTGAVWTNAGSGTFSR